MLRTVPLLALATMALSGCTYVGPDLYNDHISCLDEDDDGAVKRADCPDGLGPIGRADCDDSRSDRFPGNPEIPYDGIDQDCDNEDLVDVDGDRYPGILAADWVADHGNLTWPDGLNAGCDCDDTVPTTFPGSGANVPYDGVDSACEGYQANSCELDTSTDWDDWDADDDNHVPYEALYDGLAYPGDLPQDDCDDSKANVHPGTSVTDEWYDGIDHDCDGTNDFDQDGDAYIEDAYLTDYAVFLDTYKYEDDRACTASDGSCNDCDDDPTNDGGQPVGAAAIHPGASETWYDGVDQNCDTKNDYDQDEDTFECDGSVVGACSTHLGDDCDDLLAGVNPLALELLGDSTDQDCKAGNDGATFQVSDLSWIDPTNPTVIANDFDYVIGVAATQVDRDGTFLEDYPGAILHVPLSTAVPSDEPTLRIIEEGDPISHGVVLYPDGDDFWFGTTVASTTFSRMRTHQVRRSGGTYGSGLIDQIASSITSLQPTTCGSSGTQPCPFDDFDLQRAATDEVWLVACSGDSGHFMQTELDEFNKVQVVGVPQTFDGEVGHACWLDVLDADSAILHAYTESYGYLQFTLTVDPAGETDSFDPVVGPSHITSDYAVEDVKNHPDQDLVVFAGGSSSATPHGVTLLDDGTERTVSALAGKRTWSADATNLGGTWYVAVIADLGTQDGVKEAALLYGTNLASMTGPIALPLPDGETPQEVALYADGDRVFMVVSGEGPATDVPGDVENGVADDVVGWAMWGYAP